MATVEIDDRNVTVRLSTWEKLAGMRGGVFTVPRKAVRGCEVLERPLSAIRGIRSPGTGIPGLIAYGTYRHAHGKDFNAVHRGQRAVRLALADQTFSAMVVGVDDPDEVCTRLGVSVEAARA
jgi:hypothetical protein